MSQGDTILRLLTEANGEWVELTTLARMAGCYAVSERVSELRRKRGYAIENETVTLGDGQKRSRYRLGKGTHTETQRTQSSPLVSQRPLRSLRETFRSDLFPQTCEQPL